MSDINFPKKILLFGCGNMAGAMLEGWLRAGVAPKHFVVVEPSDRALPKGVKRFGSAAEVGAKFDHLLIGIKPQMLAELSEEISGLLAPDATVISIVAGVTAGQLREMFDGCAAVRLMPNLSVAMGAAPMGLWAEGLDDAARAAMTDMLTPLGMPEWLDSEDQMDAFTALAGSGPAFVYRFIDALAAGATATGLPQDQAERIARQMVLGAAQLSNASDASPAELARRVASPGGMTAVGLDVLDEDAALARLVRETLRATRNRGAELSVLARGD